MPAMFEDFMNVKTEWQPKEFDFPSYADGIDIEALGIPDPIDRGKILTLANMSLDRQRASFEEIEAYKKAIEGVEDAEERHRLYPKHPFYLTYQVTSGSWHSPRLFTIPALKAYCELLIESALPYQEAYITNFFTGEIERGCAGKSPEGFVSGLYVLHSESGFQSGPDSILGYTTYIQDVMVIRSDEDLTRIKKTVSEMNLDRDLPLILARADIRLWKSPDCEVDNIRGYTTHRDGSEISSPEAKERNKSWIKEMLKGKPKEWPLDAPQES